MTAAVESSLFFLTKDAIYEREKVYEFDFDPPDGFPRSNMILERQHGIQIHDIRGYESDFRIDKIGFELIEFPTGMTCDDFGNPQKIQEQYVPKVASMLQKFLGAERVQIDSCVVRRRHPEFPFYTGEFYEHKQPSALVHVDTTVHGTKTMIEELNAEEGESLTCRRHQFVNVWRPLRGPVRDWPLTLCDPSTVDPANDLVARDLLRVTSPVETYQVHFTPHQKWYFVTEQTEDEAWVFLQSDSALGGMTGVPHTSFPYESQKEPGPPRESVEIRALVYY